MADNLGYTPGVGAQIAANDIGGVHYQRAKMVIGPAGSASDWEGHVYSKQKPVNASFTRPADTTTWTCRFEGNVSNKSAEERSFIVRASAF